MEFWYYVDLVTDFAISQHKQWLTRRIDVLVRVLKCALAVDSRRPPTRNRHWIDIASRNDPSKFRSATVPLAASLGLMTALAVLVLCAWNSPAAADFRLCNNTSSRVGIALGYKDAEGWTTEGWWNVSSRSCETLLKGTLVARFYYIYALDYDRGGEWSGQAFMCSRDKEFTIKGTENCLARGFDRTGFFEVDTGEQRAWTVQLTDANEQPAQQRVPGLPGTVGPGGKVPGLPNAPDAGRAASGRRRVCRQPRLPEASHETAAPYQDPRHARSGIFGQRDDPPAVRGGRRHLPHQHEPHLARQDAGAGRDHPQCREQLRPADRHPGRPAGTEARLGSFAEGAVQLKNGQSFVLDSDKTPGDATRVHAAASGNSRSAQARATRCCSTTARCG